jgi:hypothetical protein
MVATIPVPIEFSLPDGWRSVSPDQAGAPNAAFVALHPGSAHAGFTTNITITGELRGDDVPITEIADEALDRVRATAQDVRLGRRTETGSADDPGLTQAVAMSVDLNGHRRELIQLQVFIAMRDQREPDRRAVLHIVLTALPEQFDQLVSDFQKFLATIRPEHVA